MYANYGSTGRIAEEIGKSIISNGWESYIAYGRGNCISESKLLPINSNLDLKLHALGSRLFDKEGLFSKKATNIFISKIKNFKPDIIHLHNLHGHYLNFKVLFEFIKDSNIPIVWTLHDCWPFTGHCPHYSFIGCDKWKSRCNHCPQLGMYPNSWFVDRSSNNFMDKFNSFRGVSNLHIIAVSKWLKNEISQSFLKDYPCDVIYNGLDLSIFKAVTAQSVKSDSYHYKVLGVANDWSERKGLNDFIRLRELLPSTFEIILVGLSEKQIKNLPSGILGFPRTPDIQTLIEFYSSADVYVNTSVEETLGMTSIEAQACGTPAIVYDSTACPETVTDGTGGVVKSRDLKSLAAKIQSICHKGKQSYSENCIKWVNENFNSRDAYDKYIEVYKKILNIN